MMLLFHLSHEFWEYNIVKLNLYIKSVVILLFSHRFGKSLIILKQVCPRASFIVAKIKGTNSPVCIFRPEECIPGLFIES